MNPAAAEILQREVESALQQAARQREGLRQRVAVACDTIRRRQALARAESLVPTFRAELLRRARSIQRVRDGLLQTLRCFASVLLTGDLCSESCDITNVVVVLRAVQDALRAEEKLAYWRQPLPRAEDWGAVCAAVRDNSDREGLSGRFLAEAEEDEKGNEGRSQRQLLDAALERLLAQPTVSGVAEASESSAPPATWIALPCFCTVAHYCHNAELSILATTAAKGGSSRREGVSEAPNDLAAEAEKGVSGDCAITQTAFDIAAAHFVSLGELKDVEGEKDGGKLDDILEEARLRVSIEIAARVTACRYAVDSLATGEESILFDGVAIVTGSVHFAVPVATLVLPPLEQLFFSIAYTVGAAIMRDEQNERNATGFMNTAAIVDEGEKNNKGVNEGGWRDALECWILQEVSDDSTVAAQIIGPRLLQYLLDYVFCSTHLDSKSGRTLVFLQPETARRWLTLSFCDMPDKDGAINTMLARYREC